jgi:signal transduction histidine kinase
METAPASALTDWIGKAMDAFRPRKWMSFRRRLGAAAAFNLILAIAMVAILLVTARNAAEVVTDAQSSQLRTRAFSALQFAADKYQRATYDVLRIPSPESIAALSTATKEFDAARAKIDTLPAANATQQEANRRVARQSTDLRTMMGHLPAIVEDVDEQWRAGGSVAAMRAIRAQSEPYFRLIDTLQQEIELNGDALRQSTARANDLQRAVLPIGTISLLLALAATVTVFVLIIGRLSPALRRLEHGVRAFADGQPEHRIEVSGYDEFAQLGHSFNEMASQISEQQSRLRKSASHLELAVAERTADLAEANTLLAAADQRRRVFFAEVSHELRTPITIIHGEAEVALRQAEHGAFDPSDSFVRILSQSSEMRRLINDLFLIARAEADGLELHLAPVDLNELLERVADDFQAIADDCGANIRTTPGRSLFVDGDAGRLRQVLGAAVDNAIRHGGRGVTIDLSAVRCGSTVRIAIEDDGPGVDPHILPNLLQRFRRGETAAEGSGLGLTIVRALIEAHHGEVRLANRPTGGLALHISLPARGQTEQLEHADYVGLAAGGRRSPGRAVCAPGP